MGFGYDNSVSLQTDDVGHMGAAVLVHVACVVGLQTNDVRRNWKVGLGIESKKSIKSIFRKIEKIDFFQPIFSIFSIRKIDLKM